MSRRILEISAVALGNRVRQLRSRWPLLLGILVVGVVASACTPDAASPTTTPASSTTVIVTTTTDPGPQNDYGGEVIVGAVTEPVTLNPFLPSGDDTVVAMISQSYLAGVYDVDGFTLELIPELVTELPTVANGGVVVNEDGTMTVTYQIVDEAVWSDGIPITGADFQFTFETIMVPENRAQRTVYEDIVSTEFLGKRFSYTLAFPTVQYELLFGVIIPKHDVEGTDFLSDWNDEMWVSAGPFVFDEWAKGEFLAATRNESYWKSDPETRQRLPYLDKVTFKFIPQTEALIEAFKERELDIIAPPLPSSDTIETLQALESGGARVEVVSGPVWEHVNFQFGPGRLERNENSCNNIFEMRLAVAQTIDRSALTEELFGGRVASLDSYVTPYAPSLSQDSWAQYSLDNIAAAQNYAKAVEETGKECSVVFSTTMTDTRVKTSELFFKMFEASGIPYENQLEDNQLFFSSTVVDGKGDLAEWAWQGSPGNTGLIRIHNVWDPEAPPPEGSNYYRWGTEDSSVIDESTARFTELRDAMNETVDDRQLSDLFAEAESLLADNIVFIPLYGRPSVAAVWADEIGNFKHNPSNASFTWNMELWHRWVVGD